MTQSQHFGYMKGQLKKKNNNNAVSGSAVRFHTYVAVDRSSFAAFVLKVPRSSSYFYLGL